MLPLVEIAEIVRHYESFFTAVFSPAALEQFKRYVSGLIVSDNKTVEGINRLFVFEVRHQSSLNRLLTRKSLFDSYAESGPVSLAGEHPSDGNETPRRFEYRRYAVDPLWPTL